MIPIILLVVGLIARLLDEQVGGQHAVGVGLMVVGGALLLLQVVLMFIIGKKVLDATKPPARRGGSFR